jgi:hypothetical protein
MLRFFIIGRFAEDNASCEAMKNRAKQLLDQAEDPAIKLNIRLFIGELDTFINGYKFKGKLT